MMNDPEAGPVKLLRHPSRYSNGEATIRRTPRTIGQHTDEVLSELGYGRDRVAELRRSGAV
jgi:succinate--hydroxymethylglutarate CoA-transferase